MKRYRIYKDHQILIDIKNKDILDEKPLNEIRKHGLLLSCYNEENNIIFYERGELIKDNVNRMTFLFRFDDMEDIYRKLIYECGFCYINKSITYIRVDDVKGNKFEIEFYYEV